MAYAGQILDNPISGERIIFRQAAARCVRPSRRHSRSAPRSRPWPGWRNAAVAI
jgi:hypothetical protein